jgi:hypothetical protein
LNPQKQCTQHYNLNSKLKSADRSQDSNLYEFGSETKLSFSTAIFPGWRKFFLRVKINVREKNPNIST